MRHTILGLLVLVAACETRAPATDSAAAPTDTAAPVVVNTVDDSTRRADSARIARAMEDSLARIAGTKTRPAATTTTTKTTTTRNDSLKLNPNVGRDSVTRRPRPFPNVDTTKRP